jgi:toxin-antitoxin system PIN domain toxin
LIALDTNILVAAHRRDAEFHSTATVALASLATGSEPWAIPWPCVHEFFSIVTRTGIFVPASTFDEAVTQIDVWLDSPSVHRLGEGPEHWSTLRTLILSSRTTGPRVHDARIAVICIQHGVRELWTADRDFSRFPQLSTRNPLVGTA